MISFLNVYSCEHNNVKRIKGHVNPQLLCACDYVVWPTVQIAVVVHKNLRNILDLIINLRMITWIGMIDFFFLISDGLI